MEKGVIYFNRGTKCTIRLLTSVFSLRKHYYGPITVLYAGEQSGDWVFKILEDLDVDYKKIESWEESPLTQKSGLWKYSPYKLTMFLDADTIVLNSIDEYFNFIEEKDFVTGNFANWKTSGGSISKRIKEWNSLYPELVEKALNYGSAINTGINGWKKGASLLEEWEEVSKKGFQNGSSTRVVDEIACQLLLTKHKHHLADTRWGESIKFGEINEDTVIVHYHGNKHVGDRRGNYYWKKTFFELYNRYNFDELLKPNGDRAFKKYIDSLNIKKMTIVTAVNELYLDKLKKNFPKWQKIEGLMEYPYIIFAHEDCYDDVKDYFKNYKRVNVIKWSFKNADSTREEMLSAFVFGVAKNVKTPYWMKLDCDTYPVNSNITKVPIPDSSFKNQITSNKWGYTKIKSDDKNDRHWLNILDDWADNISYFNGTNRLFSHEITEKKYKHSRIISYIEIEKTNWTKFLSEICGDKLPIPSQDTLTWYCAKRLNKKIEFYPFKKYLKH